MQIRLATLADAETIAGFNQAMALETEDKHLKDELIKPGVKRIITDSALGFYLVVEEQQQLIACLAITFEWSDWRNGLFWWIQSVYVIPEARRGGVFSKLYHHVRDMAGKTQDVIGIRLYVERDNSRAQQTYLNLGMIETDYRLMEELI